MCLLTLKSLAAGCHSLAAEIATADAALQEILDSYAPMLCDLPGVGTEAASQLLVTVGDNPDRLGNEAQFAALVGVAPIPASSGKTTRHRLSRGGDRNANHALYQVVLVRMASCQRTKDHVAQRTAEGKSKREIMRCLKCYAAREIYRQITNPEQPRTTQTCATCAPNSVSPWPVSPVASANGRPSFPALNEG